MTHLHEELISTQCRANMHLHCPDPLTCACTVCHNRCNVCGTICMNVIELPDHPAVTAEYRERSACSTCYRILTALLPKGQGCELCGGPVGYRDAADPAGPYACLECRQRAGMRIPIFSRRD